MMLMMTIMVAILLVLMIVMMLMMKMKIIMMTVRIMLKVMTTTATSSATSWARRLVAGRTRAFACRTCVYACTRVRTLAPVCTCEKDWVAVGMGTGVGKGWRWERRWRWQGADVGGKDSVGQFPSYSNSAAQASSSR